MTRRLFTGPLLLLLHHLQGQPSLVSTRESLDKLSSHREALQRKYSGVPQATQVLSEIGDNVNWLKKRLWGDSPPAYRSSLASTASWLKAALDQPRGAIEIMQMVAEDLKLKRDDCREFGMARLVPLEVETRKDEQHEGGWEVFYKAAVTKRFPNTPTLRFRGLSSPTVENLPPGHYDLYAQKRAGGKTNTTPMARVVVGGREKVLWQIPLE